MSKPHFEHLPLTVGVIVPHFEHLERITKPHFLQIGPSFVLLHCGQTNLSNFLQYGHVFALSGTSFLHFGHFISEILSHNPSKINILNCNYIRSMLSNGRKQIYASFT